MESSLAEQQRILASDWGGGKSPFGTSWSKFMMWIFIISDALTFAAFLIAYGFMRSISPEWPKQTEVFNMVLITFMTFVLISSSAVMAMAVGAARAHNPKLAFKFLVLTIVGGLTFLGCQAFEWSHMIEEGARLTHNPWGVPQFAAAFFCHHRIPWLSRLQWCHDSRRCCDTGSNGQVFRGSSRKCRFVLALR